MGTPARMRRYRRAEQWLQLIEQWKGSGLSAPAFCTEQQIGYSSFCQWRSRLTEEDRQQSPASAGFIDLSPLPTQSAARDWQVMLKLGEGIELTLRRG